MVKFEAEIFTGWFSHMASLKCRTNGHIAANQVKRIVVADGCLWLDS